MCAPFYLESSLVQYEAMKKKLKVAIVYDRVNKFGGAERVLQALRAIYPDSVLFTSVFDKQGASWVGDWEVRTTFLQHVPFAKRHHEWFALFMPLAFESLDFAKFDVVISVTSEFAKNIITHPGQLHVCYCLTPTRYLWSHTFEYGRGKLSLIKHFLFSKLRTIDILASQRPDAYIAISRKIEKRIQRYYHRDSKVLYPPTNLKVSTSKVKTKQKYFLVVSRLVPYKRVDLVIEAAKKLKRHLIVVGTGSEALRLYELGKDNPYIHFEGKVNDKRLAELYSGARALICPQEEDFGLISLEAQAHGIPVISYANSGVAETVISGKSGILFRKQSVSSLVQAMIQFEKLKFDSKAIKANISRYSDKKFCLQFKNEIDRLWKKC